MIDINFKAFFKKIWEWIKSIFTKKPEPPQPPEPKPPDPDPPDPPDPPKPPVIPKILESERYLKIGKWWTPFLIPTLGINRMINNGDYINFLNRIVNNGWGNGLRIFSAGMWERHWLNKLNFPFDRNTNDRFILDRQNLDWLNMLLWRIERAVERGIFIIVTILDNCSLKEKRVGGFWDEYWMNGFNNVNGTSPWMPSIYHYYEEMWHDIAYIREFHKKRALAGLKKDPTDEDIKKWIEKLDMTGIMIEENNDYLVNILDVTFGNTIGYEAVNEGMGGSGWHNIQLDLFNTYGIPKARRFTSVSGKDFYKKQTINSKFIPSVHGIGNVVQYLNKRQECPVPFIASADGTNPPEDQNDWKVVASRVKKDGHPGFEGNLRPIFKLENGEWIRICGKEDWSLTSMNWGWANAVRDGWNG